MQIHRVFLVTTIATLVIACGGGQTTPTTSEGSEGRTCADLGLDDPELLAQCEAREVECPGQVTMAETAPPQFGCPPGPSSPTSSNPDKSVSSPDTPNASTDACEGYSLGDACVNEENLAQCHAMAAQCPGNVQVLESCPLQFACSNDEKS
jgi:hypothetical protein